MKILRAEAEGETGG